jgi:hypothetical protein
MKTYVFFIGEERSSFNWRCEVKVCFALRPRWLCGVNAQPGRSYAQRQSAGAYETAVYVIPAGCDI